MEHMKIKGADFYNMVINGSNKLEEKKEFVNSLNVFPVPDGDTGTNMSMTFRSAVKEIEGLKEESIGGIAKKVAKGALMGARGNSGVILSQIFRGISKGLEDKDEVDAREFANALLEGSKSAYKAVMRPTEGTILTIIRAAGESAVKSEAEDVTSLLKEVCEHSEVVLNKTPDMLPVLKKAKVVDAGGQGLLIILQGMLEVLDKDLEVEIGGENKVSDPNTKIEQYEQDIEFGYCTEFFVMSENVDVDKFKGQLESLGDSMIVVAADGLVKVHIHTNDPGDILSKAIKLGPLSKIKIDNMREQHKHIIDMNSEENKVEKEESELKKYGFISVALGEGITEIFKDLGVDKVIEGGQTMNPSTEDIVKAINKINAENIFILPNNKNIIMAATQAAELSEKNIIVIPTKTIPQGITSITMFNPEAESKENENNMKEAIKAVATGSITYAVRDTEMDGKIIKENDILGLIEGKISEVGKDIFEVSKAVLEEMIDEDSELISIFYGKDCDEEKIEKFIEELEEKYEDLDIQCYNGKQPLYYFIMSVE
ncbi:DAK2 domain-containing protein [Clostridium botulinum]|uniref:Phosphatase protein n=1 Tax=Clostridium botulinum (strain Hall / ATCC 3502 / NCTC 13319 / Type A) TaxID=441771 RepID=A5I4S4_CLOBH|nr:DAK2 domain-containing protein [Clostridium botulinum]ABS33027.1 DAK2 domain protein [Clostridium botulinum A str. ATCC 19397]ABS37537.1 DAK2 domain protein [Clostridium botulinum A str. Hall]APC85186.1 DAK2 domain fusion YloV family protein [Clostridium botulinum]APQ74300.1 DAK2 domain fusion YloV family protein [Clostridium botulinum]APQ96150.1 DAK2 domain fusion YloV family protein [Clostridium botulinum]